MFCSNCGKEIETNRKFCSFCGAENVEYASTAMAKQRVTSPMVSSDGNGFNRDVLINYLGNLRTLEIAKNDLLTQKAKMEKKISSLGHRKYAERVTLWDCIVERWMMMWITMILVAVPALIANILQQYVFEQGVLYSAMSIIKALPFVVVAYNVIAVFVVYFREKQKYDKHEVWAENKVQAERTEKAKLEQRLSTLHGDISKINVLLKKAYSINVIPTNCRNIYGVYFLHDYLTTSMATLSEALFHFDLDKITQKLDRVIAQQKEQIIQIARNNALNRQLIVQNEELIQRAIAIEENTALAAQYAEVAAVNTEAMATIQAVHFWHDVSRR